MPHTKPLKITETEGDVIEIYLTQQKTPVAYARKKYELIHISGMTEEEAAKYLLKTPIPLELFYDLNVGLFGIDSEATTCSEIFNPYPGKQIPNENLPELQASSPRQTLDRIIGDLEDMNTELDNVWKEGDFTTSESSLIEDARYDIEEGLTKLHKITDPDEDLSDD